MLTSTPRQGQRRPSSGIRYLIGCEAGRLLTLPWPGAFSFLSPQVNTRDSGGKRCGMFANTSTDAICSQTNIHHDTLQRLKPRPHRLPLAYTRLRILIHDRTRMKTYDENVRTRYIAYLIYICKHKFHSR